MIKKFKLLNILKSIILSGIIGLLLFGTIYFVLTVFNISYGLFAIILSFFSSLLYILINVFLGPKIILFSVGARPLEGHPRYEEVRRIVKELSEKARIPMPKLYYFEANDINAFATGLSQKNSYIAITTGALKYLNEEELKGVLGHEIGHIKHYDMLYMTITSVLVGFISYLSQMLIYSFFYEREKPWWIYLISIIVAVLVPIIATIIQLAISREREYLADLFSLELNGKPDGLISAFRKIQMINRGNILYNEAIEPLYFVSIEELFSTHPPIEKRIERLLKAYEKMKASS